MSNPEVEVAVSSAGTISFLGEDARALVEDLVAVELWHSQPDKGLAFRFLKEPSKSSFELIRGGEGKAAAWIEAGPYLIKVGLGLPDSDHHLKVGAFDEDRGVLSTRW